MASTWQGSFAHLKEFIKDNPAIEISGNCISIPGDVRPEFYRRFDNVRTDFLKDNFPSSLEKGYELSREFAQVYKEAIAASGLEAINVRAAVNWFLQDPINGLMRSLFDPVFNLIRGKLSEQTFVENTIRLIDDVFRDYFRHGYECWTVLGLLAHLQPDKNYLSKSRDFHTDSEVGGNSVTPGMHEELVDTVTESKSIAFDGSSITNFITPRTLFHAQRLGRYVAIHTDFAEAWWRARGRSERMEWFNIKSLVAEFGRARLWPDLLVYAADDVADLNLVADYAWVARPDLIVEIEEADGWYEKGGLELAQRHVAALKPRLGCYIICRTAPPAEAYNEIMPKSPVTTPQETPVGIIAGDDALAAPQTIQEQVPPSNPEPCIHIIHAGYDFKMLDSIVEALAGQKPTTGDK
ncbi:MAG: hypothetical protein FWH51_01315 [Dehalococcoidia bacterium]|nr:hypothetical protein [Dehalococcoidia bacterium]